MSEAPFPDWQPAAADAAGEIRALAAACAAADSVTPFSGHVVDDLALGSTSMLALRETGGRLIAAALATDGQPAEVTVAPAGRRLGRGRALVSRALDAAGAVWAHGNLPAAMALASRLGLVITRELLQLRRGLTQEQAAALAAGAPLPAGVRIRVFEPGRDEAAVLGVNSRAFSWHPEQGRLDLAGLQVEMGQDWFDPAGFFLAVDETDTVLGFHWTKVHPPSAAEEAFGEVYVLAVDPQATLHGERVRGLGAPLTAAGLDHLAGLGLRGVLLYVEADNRPALDLYRRLDFWVHSTDVVYRRPVQR